MKKPILMLVLCTIVSMANAQQSTKIAFNETLKAYFELKNALAKDDVTRSSAAAEDLLKKVELFPSKSLTQLEKAEWAKQQVEIKKPATEITSTKNLALQRKNFESIARAMIKLTRTLQLNKNEVYVQFCPMAKKSWLNEVEEVQNPFYGSKMYDCGEVSATIDARP